MIFTFEEVNAACKGRYKCLKLSLSSSRPGRNKRAMTPFSAKTTMLGKPERSGAFNPLRSHRVPLKRSKNKSLPCISWMCGAITSLKWGRTERPLLLRARILFYFASQRPRFTPEQVPLRAALSLCTQRSLSQRLTPVLCAKVHPLRPNPGQNSSTPGRHCEKKKDLMRFNEEKLIIRTAL